MAGCLGPNHRTDRNDATTTLGGPPSPIFVMNPVGTGARAQEIDGEFVVLKGSTARKQGIASWTS